MKKYFFTALSLALFTIGFTASDYNNLFPDDPKSEENKTDIPSDNEATASPTWTDADNAVIPNIQSSLVDENGTTVFRIDMTGIQNKTTLEWLRLLGTGESRQNVWVEIDGLPKGIKVYNTADDENNAQVPVDLVFLVDNSGSMSQEADVIARDIQEWANMLADSGLDIRFGCVGYGRYVGANNFPDARYNQGVTGALNFTSAEKLSEYLNRTTGVDRTVGYEGSDATTLSTTAALDCYNKSGGECGVQALRFADENFTFRKRANRIYVNFTDDANYHGNEDGLKVSYLEENWDASKGTVHTVFSGEKSWVETRANGDAPWLMSTLTGGTEIYTDSSFSDVTLSSLPVTGAMQHSYIIRMSKMKDLIDGKAHIVTITIYDNNGDVKAKREFTITFSAL